MLIGDDGWAQANAEGLPAVVKVPSVRHSSLAADLNGNPLGIVWHWTGGPCLNPTYPLNLANSIRTYDRVKDRAASWHFLVAKDGRVFQSITTNRGSWHVGRPGRIGGKPEAGPGLDAWDSSSWGGRLFANINQATVGVELENAGRLVEVGGKFYCWPFWLPAGSPAHPDPRVEIPAERAVKVGGTWFDGFPEEQELAATRLLSALMLKHRWTRSVSQYGHVMFDPQRKEDPGALWLQVVLPRVLDRVFGAE